MFPRTGLVTWLALGCSVDVRVDAVGKALVPYDPALAKIVIAPLMLLAFEAMDVAISIGGVELHPPSLPGMSAPYAM